MKYLISIAVTALIIVVPFGSWYYLQTGLNYRKAIAEELVSKGMVEASYLPVLRGRTSLVVKGGLSLGFRDTVRQIYDQYEDGLTFQLVEMDSSAAVFGDRHRLYWNDVDLFDDMYDMTLVDTSGAIRASYPANAVGVSKAIEHLAVVMPKPQPRDIRMKGGADYDAKPEFMKKDNK